MAKKHYDRELLESVAKRAHYLANQMIFLANYRDDVEKGDPKVGGHSSASSSALHITGALHLVVRTGFDHIANKPHASPADHSYNYLLDLFLDEKNERMSAELCDVAMHGLRAFSKNGEPVFQSYHSAYDPDRHNFFPSGTVGIPPVKAGYLALAYRYAKKHGYDVPPAHFWAIIGDSEFREGSLFEAVPDFAERELGNLTWIVDYNRQSLDGHRMANEGIYEGTDADRIEGTMAANGWEVFQARHGSFRQGLFKKKGGEQFKAFLEKEISDYELQVLLQIKDEKVIKTEVLKLGKKLDGFLKEVEGRDLIKALADFGGHDFDVMIEMLEASKKNQRKPTIIIAHTLKGWGLQMAATPGNHSSLPDGDEIEALKAAQGLKGERPFQRFTDSSREGQFLKKRGDQLLSDIRAQHELKAKNLKTFKEQLEKFGAQPDGLDINLKMATYPHTQWMLGQLTAKLTRIANTPLDESKLAVKQKPLPETEKPWKLPGEMIVSMAPDVGTSTNLNPSMDGKIFSSYQVEDFETELGVKDKKTPDLIPGEEASDRFLRFEIVEANTMSCMGSFGKMRDILGIPLMPLMTVYDFFVKRALDQYFYNQYWKSSFIMVGTPAGVTLSSEGAQHGWKSDFQIPNQITWEPYYCQELDWIFSDALWRHVSEENEGRSGVHIRGVTRGADQKELLKRLKRQARFKISTNHALALEDFQLQGATIESEVESIEETAIMAQLRDDVLAGAYYLVDYRGYAGYSPGDNVVHIFAMGALGTEALKASDLLLEKGVYANVIMVTSPDLVAGNLAHIDQYRVLRERLEINADLHLVSNSAGSGSSEFWTLAGRRTPIVSVHDGEIGLLDNLGSIVGVRQESLGTRKHSKCGRPSDVYRYHHMDAESIVEACGKVLAETAIENVQVHSKVLEQRSQMQETTSQWQQLWPSSKSH